MGSKRISMLLISLYYYHYKQGRSKLKEVVSARECGFVDIESLIQFAGIEKVGLLFSIL
jgi:hypothetical protein